MGGISIGQLVQLLGFYTGGDACSMRAIEPRFLAEPFEELRDASDKWRAVNGRLPAVFLANLGPISHHATRAALAKSFLEAGGFEVLGNDGYPDPDAAARAMSESGTEIAAICSSDALYPDVVPRVAPQLKAAGARRVLLFGSPGEHEAAWRAAGVDRFIDGTGDWVGKLRELLCDAGVDTR
jgi:methylmalonyl-CoA mutase